MRANVEKNKFRFEVDAGCTSPHQTSPTLPYFIYACADASSPFKHFFHVVGLVGPVPIYSGNVNPSVDEYVFQESSVVRVATSACWGYVVAGDVAFCIC